MGFMKRFYLYNDDGEEDETPAPEPDAHDRAPDEEGHLPTDPEEVVLPAEEPDEREPPRDRPRPN